jgi:YD repeat-containing protein
VVQIMNAGVNCPFPDTESSSVSATTRFYYDGQGNQVKRLDPDGSYTVYFFGMDEIRFGSNAGETIYYPAGGAMRVSGTLKFILSDQLGSTSVMTSDSGVEQGRMGYYPFGKTRYSSPVERTGQAGIYPPIDSTQGSS